MMQLVYLGSMGGLKKFWCIKDILFAGMFIIPLVRSVQPAFAVPDAVVDQKLRVISIFVVADKDGNFVFSEGTDAVNKKVIQIIPVFFDSQLVLGRIKSLEENSKLKNLQIAESTLDQIKPLKRQIAEALSKSGQDIPVEFSFVVPDSARKSVKELHSKNPDAVEDSLLTKGLPVFYSSPMLNTGNSSKFPKNKDIFFFSLPQLQSVLESLNRTPAPVIKASDFNTVYKFITSQDEDKYYFYPSPNYILRNKLGR